MVKYLSLLLLSLSIAAAGFPAQARPGCPMAKMTEMQADTQEHGKKGCCDDAACNAKCSALAGGVSMNLPAVKADVPAVDKDADRSAFAEASPASLPPLSQEHPPKSLS